MRYYGIQNEVKAYMNRLQSEQGISVPLSAVKTINDRVEALKKSGVWSRFSLGFNDADGDAYLTRAGVTDPLGRCEVLWFTRGLKALNLWSNMVAWTMRSYQNRGTSSTVYSLGGLGTFNGTIANGPTWGYNSITFPNTSTTGVIDVGTLPSIATTLTVISPLSTINATSNSQAVVGCKSFSGISLGSSTTALTNEIITWYTSLGDDGGATNYTTGYTTIGATLSSNNYYYIGTSTNNTDTIINLNGVNLSVPTGSNPRPLPTGAYKIGNRGSNTIPYYGNISFNGLMTKRITISDQILFFSLYKSTLGSNLGLP
jgi:hypothetical protein